MLIYLTAVFEKNQHTTKVLSIFLVEIMQDVRRMKNSPLSSEEVQRIEEVVISVSADYLLFPVELVFAYFSPYSYIDAGAQDIQI